MLPGGSGEIALLTAIDAALEATAGELPDRVALVRWYLGAALDADPGSRRATFKVIAELIIRDLTRGAPRHKPPAAATNRTPALPA